MVPRILAIAGSDSSGGAGLEADQKVIAAHGCYAMTATTALTAQNTQGVYAVHEVPPTFLRKQIDACLEDVGVDVVKTGMLASAATIEVVAQALSDHKVGTVVVDPVMIATTGAKLLPPSALNVMIEKLLPLTTLLTPNIDEANYLLEALGRRHWGATNYTNIDEFITYAHLLACHLPCKYVLVKGGHCPFTKDGKKAETEEEKEVVVDLLWNAHGEGELSIFKSPYQRSKHTHGTGCSLASAIACNLAKGMDIRAAVGAASNYVAAAIQTAPGLGKGNGPLNHFHSTYTLPFGPGRFMSYLLQRKDVAPVWRHYTQHPFVMALGDGSLPLQSFKGYLIQDYLFLVQFSRAYALAAYKSKSIADITKAAQTVLTLLTKEISLHIKYCAGFGISQEELEKSEELPACTAYTRYVLDVGQSQDHIALLVALAPCITGYQAIANYLNESPDTVRGTHQNRYWDWIEMYLGEEYGEAVGASTELLEKYAVQQSPSRIEELVGIFKHAVKMEIGFWDMFPSA